MCFLSVKDSNQEKYIFGKKNRKMMSITTCEILNKSNKWKTKNYRPISNWLLDASNEGNESTLNSDLNLHLNNFNLKIADFFNLK